MAQADQPKHSTINWRSRIVRYDKIRASEITPHPQNPRRHPQFQRDVVAASFEELGQIAPIVINVNNGYLVDGEERSWLALDQDDDVELDVIYVDLTEEEHQKALLYLDHSASLAEIDAARLDDLLRDVNSDQPAIQQMLAELAENNGLYGDEGGAGEAPEPQIDRAAELQQVWQTERGQLWVIPSKSGTGEHRLLCGDSTNAEDVARVMGGERADMVMADPPYGMGLDVDYDDMFRNDYVHRKTGERFDAVLGDDEPFDPRPTMALFATVQEQFWWGADYYADKIPELTSGVFVVWDKRCSEAMDAVVGNVYELAWSKQKHRKRVIRLLWSGHHGMQTDDTHERVHPTQKPTALYKWLINEWGADVKVVIDPFSGSGTTIVACEQLGRQCRAIEIEPKYCAVTLERMFQLTGERPFLATS